MARLAILGVLVGFIGASIGLAVASPWTDRQTASGLITTLGGPTAQPDTPTPAHINTLGLKRSMRQQHRIREVIVEHDIRLLKTFLAPQGQELRISRTRSDQIDSAYSWLTCHQALP
jgi:hypothetical protein